MITIDPNLRGCGVAASGEKNLFKASYVKNPHTDLASAHERFISYTALANEVRNWCDQHEVFEYDFVLIERPRIYPGMPQTDLNDLLDVMGVASAVAVALALDGRKVFPVFPSDWKGNVKKSIMLERIWSKLSDEEKAVVQKTNKSDTEDILDSVGIGLWKLNRLTARKFAND